MNYRAMIETILISVSCAISVLAGTLAVLALKAADPLEIRNLRSIVQKTLRDLGDEIEHIKTVELPRTEAACEAVLERADQRFESAENKRKSVAARQQYMAGPGGGNGGTGDYLDSNLSRQERKAALEALFRPR